MSRPSVHVPTAIYRALLRHPYVERSFGEFNRAISSTGFPGDRVEGIVHGLGMRALTAATPARAHWLRVSPRALRALQRLGIVP